MPLPIKVSAYPKDPLKEDSEYPFIYIEYLEAEYIGSILIALEQVGLSNPKVRAGYSIIVDGYCCKAAQGINWEIRIEFEIEALKLVDIFLETLKQYIEDMANLELIYRDYRKAK